MALSLTPPEISLREETTNQFLDRREKELVAQIAALRGQLSPKEAELSQIQRMRASLTIAGGNVLTSHNALAAVVTPNSSANVAYNNALVSVIGGQSAPPYPTMTIKELTIQALLDHFPNGGTAAEIRDFIRDAYRRTVEPSSLRPQMHRLKAAGSLVHDASTDTWNLDPRKRQLYTMYDHPTSRRGMPELQDDPAFPWEDDKK